MVSPSSATRCPACGQRLEAPVHFCPLCGFELSAEGATGADVTPYAQSYAHERPQWRRMLSWVWWAGAGRMKHLALMRVSAASRRFATINACLLAVGVGLCEWTLTGWRWSYSAPLRTATEPAGPRGEGWFHVAGLPRPLAPGFPDGVVTDLWWNPAQCLIAVPLSGTLGLLFLWLLGRLVASGIRWSHSGPYRKEERLTAALRYSTAWGIPLVAAALIVAVRPVAYAAAVTRWDWAPPDSVCLAIAAIVGGGALGMWWFWLARVGATAPRATRGRVVGFFVVVLPLMAAGFVAAWWFGRQWLFDWIFTGLGLQF